jgi:hypothetical protein
MEGECSPFPFVEKNMEGMIYGRNDCFTINLFRIMEQIDKLETIFSEGSLSDQLNDLETSLLKGGGVSKPSCTSGGGCSRGGGCKDGGTNFSSLDPTM